MKKLDRVALASLPTPVEALPSLTTALGGPQLLVKRDDLTGLAFGGNKTRKLEYLAAEARAKGARMLITAGSIQSNHCRQTAAAARKLGMDCTLVLVGKPTLSPEANTYLDMLFGAELIWVPKPERRELRLKEVFAAKHAASRKPFLIPYGGSNPTGAAAYAYAVQELAKQKVEPDWIVFATSSGGTQAGLVAGVALTEMKTKVLGISVDEKAKTLADRVATLATETVTLLGEKKRFKSRDIRVNDDYLGAGYAEMGNREHEAIHLFARHEGLLLDPVYTGRAAAGLADLIRKDFFKKKDTVLFWHTGGQPALFADKYRTGLLE
ncbi:MAG: D-cysteine desulfhydrase family protein [Anaerolineae bacterium]|nr:MAG: D-cysteine desulfhydrase family protein [Anaerolineae bacterium]